MSEEEKEVHENADQHGEEAAEQAAEKDAAAEEPKAEDPAAENNSADDASAGKADEGKPEDEAKKAEAEKKAADEELNTKYMRVMAEYQNFRTRTAKEKADIYAFANEKIICEMLGIMDNFERAMAAKPEGDSFADGMELILKQFETLLEKNNVKEIEAAGKPFDPNFHNAVMTEDAEGVESGTVTKVLQKGYLLNSKVIRPAMVAVSK